MVMTSYQEVFSTLLSLSATSRLPGLWQAIDEGDSPFRALPGDRNEFLGRLRAKHTDEQLLAAGILWQPKHGGPLALNPQLMAEPGYLRPYFHEEATTPGQIVAALWGLDASCNGALTCAVEELCQSELTAEPVFVCFAMADMAVLQYLEFDVIPGTRLPDLRGEALDVLCQKLGLATRRSTDEEAPASAPLLTRATCGGPSALAKPQTRPTAPRRPARELVLVDWSVANLASQPYPVVSAIAVHFAQLAQVLDFEISRVRLWRPTSLQLIRKALQYGTRSDVDFQVDESRENYSYELGSHPDFRRVAEELSHYTADPPAPPTTYPSALRTWHASQHTSTSTHSTTKLRQELTEAFDRDILQGILPITATDQDPIERLLMTQVAGVARHIQECLLKPHTDLPSADGAAGKATIPTQTLQLKQLVDIQLKLVEGLQACHRKSAKRRRR